MPKEYKKSPYISVKAFSFLWSHMDSNHGPPDYESSAIIFYKKGSYVYL